ncbi:MAG: hypothetical protein MJE68_29770 [Proteobacteria bacterium]|nr:hypothetical protein [Pseudomonadota bacterium]
MIIERDTVQFLGTPPIPCEFGKFVKVYDENGDEFKKAKTVDTVKGLCHFNSGPTNKGPWKTRKYGQLRVSSDAPPEMLEFAKNMALQVGWL